MSLSFKPKTEKEIQEENNIAPGIYPFEVITAEAGTSKKKNPMIVTTLRIFMPDGTERSMFAFLMAAMPAQLFHFCTYCGLAKEYGEGTLTPEACVGKTGYVQLAIQKGKKKEDSDEFWPDRTSVKDYVRPEPLRPGAMAPKSAASDDDVPY